MHRGFKIGSAFAVGPTVGLIVANRKSLRRELPARAADAPIVVSRPDPTHPLGRVRTRLDVVRIVRPGVAPVELAPVAQNPDGSTGAYILDTQTGEVFGVTNNEAPTLIGSVAKAKK